MEIISAYKIGIDRNRNIDFVLDSSAAFKSLYVSLFHFSTARMYGQRDFLKANEEYINYLTKLTADKNYKEFSDEGIPVSYDFCWQHDVFVELLHDSVYIEKWGLCTKIKIDELLAVFNSLHLFLKRWTRKEVLIEQIKKVFFLKESERAKELYFVNNASTINNDEIRIMLKKEDFEMEVDEFIESLEFPIHIT